MDSYMNQSKPVKNVVNFLDHLCHPTSLLVYLFGMPRTLFYQRSEAGGGLATFTFSSGMVASLALTHAAPFNGGMEHTLIVSDKRRSISVKNNTQVSYHRDPP